MKYGKFYLLLLLISIFALGGCDCGDDDDDDTASEADDDDDDTVDDDDDSTGVPPTPTDDAFARPGPTGDGRWILPNGRFISPVGDRVTVKRFPMSIALNPDGDMLYVATARLPSLAVVNLATMKVEEEVFIKEHFGGMAFSADGSKLWVGGGSREVIYEFIMAGSTPVENRQIPAFGYPTDLRLSGDETLMYVTMAYGKKVSVIDIATGVEVGVMSTGTYPYDVAVSEVSDRVITSNWGTRVVSIFRLSDYALLSDIEVGKNPEGVLMTPDGQTAFVACSDSDTVVEVDLVNLEVTREFPLYEDMEAQGHGAMPTELAFTPDGTRLLVTATGLNSLDVINIATGQVEGRIPTEWYPTHVRQIDDVLYVLSGKGTGSGPGNVDDEPEEGTPPSEYPEQGGQLFGSVEAILMPDNQTLAEYTEMVEENNTRTSRFYDLTLDYDSPIPTKRGVPSDKIKHVVFILKENKTYDQILGDLEGTERDESLVLFGEQITPNIHALAREFTVSDNYYSESHESDMGHAWATNVLANDYVEKNWVADDWFALTGVEPASIPESKTVFHNMLENEVPFRVYGEVVGILSDVEKFSPYIDFNYGFYTFGVSDRLRAREVIREWEAGNFPRFIYILLPNDHGEGTDEGRPTYDYYVADNDAGMGLIVDWIVKSPYWGETAVFITQDDPQSGVDHIDAHRTPLVVVSPYAKRGYVSSVHHSMASLWLTFEMILGLPPITNYDRFTAPMFDMFQSEPNLEAGFEAIPSNVPFALNPPGLPWADYCSRQNWDVPDQVERIGEVAWAYMKPGVPYPYHYAVAPSEAEEEEAEEEEAGKHYRQMMKAYIEYGQAQGLFDPKYSLHGKVLHPQQ